MTMGDGRVHLDPSAFRYLKQAATVVNQYSDRAAGARSRVEAALAAPNLFVGREGAALAKAVLHSGTSIHTAMNDAEATALDMAQVLRMADEACHSIRNVDEVISGMFDANAKAANGVPWKRETGGPPG
jgi:hypothetical protein